ncbi:MAG: metal ABC transporter ATP-binding protein [Christensenellales bacterium]|jgi:zinc transport system ATP-binding protein
MISIENLYFSYTGSPPFVLNGINLRIKDGEYVSFLGDNGSGKTTLMRLILKLLSPTSGKIALNTRRIGYVPQRSDFSNSHFPITVFEAMNSYRKLLRIKDKGVIQSCLAQVSMEGFENSLMGALSGGQNQKILIARALMGNPDLLVLDEPSTGVDLHSQTEIYACLKKLNRENGITILSVEHNLGAAIANSTLIYHLKGGNGHLCSPQKYADEFLNPKGADQNA